MGISGSLLLLLFVIIWTKVAELFLFINHCMWKYMDFNLFLAIKILTKKQINSYLNNILHNLDALYILDQIYYNMKPTKQM